MRTPDLSGNKHANAGKTIIQMIEDQLDIKYDKLMEFIEEDANWTADMIEAELLTSDEHDEDSAKTAAAEIVASAEMRGVLTGMCAAIAMMHNPRKPDVSAQKVAAKERWDNAQ